MTRRHAPALPRQSGRTWPGMLLFLLLVAAYAWWYYAPDTIPDAVRAYLPHSARSNPALYRWKDDKGRPHVTDTPPTDRPYEKLRYAPGTNVVPSVVPPPPQGTNH